MAEIPQDIPLRVRRPSKSDKNHCPSLSQKAGPDSASHFDAVEMARFSDARFDKSWSISKQAPSQEVVGPRAS